MKITGKYSIAFFLKLGIDFILLVNVLVLLTLPFLLNELYNDPQWTNTGRESVNGYSESGYSKNVNDINASASSGNNNDKSSVGGFNSSVLAESDYDINDQDSSAYRENVAGEGNSRWIFLNEIPDESYGFMLGFLYFSGASTAVILFLLRKVLRNLEKDIILDHSNARTFKRLSAACFVLVASFVVKMIFYNTFLTIFSFFVFVILGLFTLVLSEVFRQGAIAREDNELTI